MFYYLLNCIALLAHLLNYFDELPNNNDKESYLSFLNSINYE